MADQYECVFFSKKLNLTFKISKGYIFVINDDDTNNRVDTNHSNICKYCWNICTNLPAFGSIVVSVNGCLTTGLDKDFQLALLRSTQRPLVIRFKSPTIESISLAKNTNNTKSNENIDSVDSTSTLHHKKSFDCLGDVERLKYSLFVSKYNHALASPLRKQVDKIIQDYLDCDWISVKDKQCLPQDTIISLYRYIESELVKLGLFDCTTHQGLGIPIIMTDTHWDSLREHIETFLFKKVYSYTKQIGPSILTEEIFTDSKNINDSLDPDDAFEAEEIDPPSSSFKSSTSSSWLPSSSSSSSKNAARSSICSPLMMKLASLRFVTLENLGLKVGTVPLTELINLREEWSISIKGLTRALTQESPGQILSKLVLTLRMISHALQAYLKYPDGIKIEYQCSQCSSMNGDANDLMIRNLFDKLDKNKSSTEFETFEFIKRLVDDTESNNSQYTISADDFLPALTYVLIKSNPPNIETILWLASEFRHPSLLHGEESFCLAQVQSAIVWCKRVNSGSSFDLDEEYYRARLQQYEYSLQLILACKHGDIENIVLLLNLGADINALTPDQRDCPLTACIRYKQKDALIRILQNQNVNVNINLFKKATPLMIAVQHGDVDDVLRLLKKGADRHGIDEYGATALTLAATNSNIATILNTESKDIDILDCIRRDSEGQTSSGVLMTLFLQDISGVNKLYENDTTTPLIEATKFCRVHVVRVLLTIGKADVNLQNEKRESALFHCLKTVEVNDSFPNNVHNRIPDIIFVVSMLLRAGASDDNSSAIIKSWSNVVNSDSKINQHIKNQIVQLFQTIDIPCVGLVKDNNYNAIMNLILLGKEEQLNESCPLSKTTPLIASIIYENHIIFNLLVEANHIDSIISLEQEDEINMRSTNHVLISINKPAARGLTALMFASQKGIADMIGSLLRVGADRNLLSSDKNYTAFDIASLNNCLEAMNVLKYNPVTDSICLLAKQGDWVGVRSLILQGVSINSRQRHVNDKGAKIYELYSPLIAATAFGQKDLLKNLLAVDGIDVDMANQLGIKSCYYSFYFLIKTIF